MTQELSDTALTARNRLVMNHMPSVKILARRLIRATHSGMEIDDLISAGTLALIDVAGRVDPSRENEFWTFAERRVRGAMLDVLPQYDQVKESRGTRELRRAVETQIQPLREKYNFRTSDRELLPELVRAFKPTGTRTQGMRITEEKLLKALEDGKSDKRKAKHHQLNAGMQHEFDQAADDPSQEENLLMAERKIHVRAALVGLPAKERTVLVQRYVHDLEMTQIGENVGLKERGVFLARRRALGRVKAALEETMPSLPPEKRPDASAAPASGLYNNNILAVA
jgi:RNA polymerase sigma factor FliA